MLETIWVRVVNEMISLVLLSAVGFFLYRGFKKNQEIFSEREDLIKRYLLFRGDRLARLKIYGRDEKVHADILRNISNSWKNFKKSYDQYLNSLARNTSETKRILNLLTLGLLINTARLAIEDYYFGVKTHLYYTVPRELSSYVLVVLGLFLLRNQTRNFLTLKGEVMKMDPEILFFPNHIEAQEEHEGLYNEFDPLEAKSVEEWAKEMDSDK